MFTAYHRTRYWAPVLESWQAVRGLHDWTPTVYLEPSSQQDTMRALAADANIDVRLNPHRRGVLSNPWHAVDSAFSDGADFVVLAEDDVLVSEDILEYFTWASTTLDRSRILAVCACSMAPTVDPADTRTVAPGDRFNPLVWGTWREHWFDVLGDTWDHDYSTGTPNAPQSGWDWNINLRVMPGRWQVAAPLASRSTHIGQYNGTHMHPVAFPASQSPTFAAHHPPGPYRWVSDR